MLFIRYILGIFFFLFISLNTLTAIPPCVKALSSYSCSTGTIASYPVELESIISKIQQLPEVEPLLAQIQKKGPIRIELASNSGNFDAMWSSGRRVIMINPNKHRSESTIIVSLLFEMHNAARDHELLGIVDAAASGEIDKDRFVYLTEKLEHENCLNTCRLLKLGIERGLFPDNTTWNIYSNFEDHYKIQQLHGHSIWLAHVYNQYNPKGKAMRYRGTIEGLDRLSSEDRLNLERYLAIKNGLYSSDPKQILTSREEILLEHAQLKEAKTTRQHTLFHSVFVGLGLLTGIS